VSSCPPYFQRIEILPCHFYFLLCQTYKPICPHSFNMSQSSLPTTSDDASLKDKDTSSLEHGTKGFELYTTSVENGHQKSPSPRDPSSFPDGGTKAWLTVAGCSACMFVSFGWVNCVGLFQNHYQQNQLKECSTSTVAWIPSLQSTSTDPYTPKKSANSQRSLLHALPRPLHRQSLRRPRSHRPPLRRRLPPRFRFNDDEYFDQILPDPAEPSRLLSDGGVYGILSGLHLRKSNLPPQSLLNVTRKRYYRPQHGSSKRRGAAIGLVAAGSSLGGVIFPIMIIHLLPEVGFAWTIRICAFLILALLIFAIATFRSRLPPSKRPCVAMSFVRPLGERPFLLITLGAFFFWCKDMPARRNLVGQLANAGNRGGSRRLYLHR
jgi:hypothetical protein